MSQPAARRGPGRPRRHTEEEILDVAERLLREEGRGSISVRRVAEELGSAPMTLYTTYPRKQDMLDALAARLLGRHDVLPDQTLPLDERIAEWMWRFRRAVTDGRLYELFSDGPPLATLVATVGEWLHQLSVEGWHDDDAVVWSQHLLWSVNGFCLTQATAGRVPRSVLGRVAAEQRPWAERYLDHVPATDADALFDLLVQAIVAGVRAGSHRRRR